MVELWLDGWRMDGWIDGWMENGKCYDCDCVCIEFIASRTNYKYDLIFLVIFFSIIFFVFFLFFFIILVGLCSHSASQPPSQTVSQSCSHSVNCCIVWLNFQFYFILVVFVNFKINCFNLYTLSLSLSVSTNNKQILHGIVNPFLLLLCCFFFKNSYCIVKEFKRTQLMIFIKQFNLLRTEAKQKENL